jgi:hypothetical protein
MGAGLLEQRGDLDGAIEVLSSSVSRLDVEGAEKLVALLTTVGDVSELRRRARPGRFVAMTRRLADWADQVDGNNESGSLAATLALAGLLARTGQSDEALKVLREEVDAGYVEVREPFALLLATTGHHQELETRAALGDWDAWTCWRRSDRRQRVRPGPEHQLLQIPDPLVVLGLRRREDPLTPTPYVILAGTPIGRVPVENAGRDGHINRSSEGRGSPSSMSHT